MFKARCPALSDLSHFLRRLSWERLASPAGRGLGEKSHIFCHPLRAVVLVSQSLSMPQTEAVVWGCPAHSRVRAPKPAATFIVYAAEQGVCWRTPLPRMLQERFMVWRFKDVIRAELIRFLVSKEESPSSTYLGLLDEAEARWGSRTSALCSMYQVWIMPLVCFLLCVTSLCGVWRELRPPYPFTLENNLLAYPPLKRELSFLIYPYLGLQSLTKQLWAVSSQL